MMDNYFFPQQDDEETPSQFADYSDDEAERSSRKKAPTYKDGESGEGGAPTGGPRKKQARRGAYVPPRPDSQRSRQNVFYRQSRSYNPHEFGPVRWDHPHAHQQQTYR